ncbi:SLBB domain-containing protein [Pedobacter namyangjuensis]|uniref:SLBB domain-containing protein n=1 Tax=Pedobacter namyangjuensis TaxID=600626 RepID=UPI00196424CE|nr:SLBB domain-containing protein [Pedobacter namyangjuensis]
MKNHLLQFLILILISFAVPVAVMAQQNFANVKVDELSDAQVLKVIKDAEAMGFTSPQQLEQMALARGMKAEEVQKFKLRAEKLKAQGGAAQTTDKPLSTGREMSETTQGGSLTNEKRTDEEEKGPKIFGSELFKNGNITFEPNLRIATPRNYVVGPDDKLIIDLTGDNEVNYNLAVSTEGVISLPYVGRVVVGGLTIEQASAKIRSAMARTYPGLASGRTSLAINLGNIRSIKVTITGQATKTGTYTLSSLSSVYNALNAAGGPSANGSFRNIQVIRGNRVIATLDVYDYILRGLQTNNIRLQDQDVINIPTFDKRVEVTGEVKNPAFFEVVKGETLRDVINFASGFTTEAYTAKIKVFQNTSKERRISDIADSEFNTYNPQNGDKFIVEAILERFENRVEITGSVFRPGVYELERGLTLKGLITKADGLTEDAFLNRGYINRLNPDQTASLISFDVAKIFAGTEADITLLREDKVTISSIFDLREEYTVSIQGEVRAPGSFQYADNLKLEDLIQMAGGFKEGATPNRIEVARRVRNADPTSKKAQTATLFTLNVDRDLKLTTDTFTIQPFDIISVRSSESYTVQRQVKLEGEVLYPGLYTIANKDERISDLIKRAGGLTAYAYADGASLKRPGAEVVNPNDKNAINTKDEDDKKLLGLKRAQEAGVKDTVAVDIEQKLIQSDLVGINLVKILDKPQSKFDILVEDGDIIRVPKQLQTVKVSGEVLNPNSIVYLPAKGLKQYVNGAGGFTTNARKGNVYVIYPNGSAAAVSSFLFFRSYPKIKPGSEILVPKRADREKISPQAWIGIGTALASLGAIVVSLLR